MKDRELLIFLHTLNKVGWHTISRLVNNLPSLNDIFNIQPLELSTNTGIDYSLAEKIYSALNNQSIKQFQQKLNDWEKQNIKIITFFDDLYPDLLKEIAQPPWVIFAIGDCQLLKDPMLAIVGTRNPTNYGKIVAESIAKSLTNNGFTVISGLARGIDRIAHEGALKNDGKTIGVLGSGIDIIYPRENQKLYNDIVKTGLIISEYSPGTPPHPGHFPQRNRIISGLSYGTIVVEASMKSGSLITAQYALDQSREVFAVPGPITSEQSFGSNSLIKQGAKLVQQVEDILEELPYQNIGYIKKQKEKNDSDELNKLEIMIYEIIPYTTIHINDIYNKVNLNLSEIYEVLFSLQLKGKIKQVPGGLYIRVI